MHKAARNKGNEVSCPRECTKWCYRQTSCGSKALGNTYHLNCVCRMIKDSKLPQQKFPKILQDKRMPLEFGCWTLERRTASLWDDESNAPSQVLSRAGSSSPLWTCLFPSSWQSPLGLSTEFWEAQHQPSCAEGSSHRHQSRASTSRGRWAQGMGENHDFCSLHYSELSSPPPP